MKYLWSLTSVEVLWPDPPGGRIQGGAKIGHGGPLLQETSSSDRKATATNRMHSNDLEACGKKCCYFLVPAGNAYPSGHLVPSPIFGLANAPIVETKFLELAMSLLDFSPRIPLGTFSILLPSRSIIFDAFFTVWTKSFWHI